MKQGRREKTTALYFDQECYFSIKVEDRSASHSLGSQTELMLRGLKTLFPTNAKTKVKNFFVKIPVFRKYILSHGLEIQITVRQASFSLMA